MVAKIKTVKTLLVGTHNMGKVAEYHDLLADIEASWIGLGEAGIDWEIDETGDSFENNAVLKATRYAQTSELLTLADDSGLEVDALNGQPGVHTARFGGEGLDSVQRYQLLLDRLAGVPWDRRTARFRCAIALANRDGLLATASGAIEGRIALAPSGAQGFGYDPVFYVPEFERTMAQLPADVKNRISHRARALEALRPQLEAALRKG